MMVDGKEGHEPGMVVVKGVEVVRKGIFERREEDIVRTLRRAVHAQKTVDASLDLVLQALQTRGYEFPRVYRKKGEVCILIQSLGLPEEYRHGTSFSMNHPILERVINDEAVYANSDVFSSSTVLEPIDPLYYIREQQPTLTGLIGIPYIGHPVHREREVKGTIIANYDPKRLPTLIKGVNANGEVEDREGMILSDIGEIIGEKVANIVDLEFLARQNEQLRKTTEALELANRHLTDQAYTDELTGMPNKRRFGLDLTEYMAAIAKGFYYNLLMYDCDGFKGVNDSPNGGHPRGDRFLRDKAELLLKMQKNDSRIIKTYRLGGDEFGVVYNSASVDEVTFFAEILNRCISQIPVPEDCKPVTASIGIMTPEMIRGFNNAAELLNKIDQTLYRAKSRKDCVMFYER
ncbi:GGDEF domain-containing protein [Candidatus Woesearchaeota archaeon]|nr:GGDEF domain-containing protein [Candidatus Woesearchaeota archaeon]